MTLTPLIITIKKIFSKCMIVTATIMIALFIGWNQMTREPQPGFHVVHFNPASKEKSCVYQYLDDAELRKFYSIFARSKLNKPVKNRFYELSDYVLLTLVNEKWQTILNLTISGEWFIGMWSDEQFSLGPAGFEEIKHTLEKWHKNRGKKCSSTEKEHAELLIKLNSAPSRRIH